MPICLYIYLRHGFTLYLFRSSNLQYLWDIIQSETQTNLTERERERGTKFLGWEITSSDYQIWCPMLGFTSSETWARPETLKPLITPSGKSFHHQIQHHISHILLTQDPLPTTTISRNPLDQLIISTTHPKTQNTLIPNSLIFQGNHPPRKNTREKPSTSHLQGFPPPLSRPTFPLHLKKVLLNLDPKRVTIHIHPMDHYPPGQVLAIAESLLQLLISSLTSMRNPIPRQLRTRR